MLCSRHGASDLGAGAEASKAAVRNPPPPPPPSLSPVDPYCENTLHRWGETIKWDGCFLFCQLSTCFVSALSLVGSAAGGRAARRSTKKYGGGEGEERRVHGKYDGCLPLHCPYASICK
mmetsp:Transcript_3320/g.10278  ORF Transcript_3320/g.10278 Transcript_3320/m.10278 type:complete len:119 (+) Transcript_3320:1712-2068(+)